MNIEVAQDEPVNEKKMKETNSKPIRTNSLQAWLLASRPKTLSGALAPIVIATALAQADGGMRPAVALLCAAFALLMQVAANLINDYFDYVKGTDGEDRLGPERAMAQGWITAKAMRWGIFINILIAAAVGLALAYITIIGFQGDTATLWLVLIGLGAACVSGAFFYTLLMSYIGLGDVLVWLFFGLIPVTATYFAQTHTLTLPVWLAAVACGLVIDTLLVLNNYRDRDTDRAAQKHTLVSVFGERFGSYFYFIQGVVGCALVYVLSYMGYPVARLVVFYLYFHLTTWQLMVKIHNGRELNRFLGLTARNILIFGLLFAVGVLLRN